MNTFTSPLLACTMVVVLSSTACVAPQPDGMGEGEGELVDTLEGAIATHNALTANALTANALTANALTANALTANALTANALLGNELTASALKDEASRDVLRYVVGCALSAGAVLDLGDSEASRVYYGELGLAPEWGEEGGSCDAECQGWVSACVLARINAKGVSVPISVRGMSKALQSTEVEEQKFGAREATYFGNVFVSPQLRHACLSPGQTSIPRVCGVEPSELCVVGIVGNCADACKEEADDGSFEYCSSAIVIGDSKTELARAPFAQAVTVFLQ
jgi:hypothetical protein